MTAILDFTMVERRLSAFDDAVMGHFVDHLSRAECVKTCTRHNDRLGLRHQQRGRQRRQDGVYALLWDMFRD